LAEVTVARDPYRGSLLLHGIGSLYADPTGEPLTGAWLLLENGRVAACGTGDQPSAARRVDCAGGAVIPAPIDSHTHLLFGGDRSEEFAQRARGESYAARLAAGGGIHATVASTAATSDAALIEGALERIQSLADNGVDGVEVKTGYGLSVPAERRLMHLLNAVRDRAPITVYPTLLIHVPPPGLDVEDLLDRVILELLPQAANDGFGLDVFVEENAFTVKQGERLLAAAAGLGLTTHVHADQLSASGASGLAARHRAASAEHLEQIDDADIAALASAGTVANLLPGAWLQTGCGLKPPVERLRAAGVPLGVASDLNPGSSYVTGPVLAASLAISCFGLTVEEALAGITFWAAKAVGDTGRGTLLPGSASAAWHLDLPGPAALFQRLGAPRGGTLYGGDR
jgi:imidazolonepropionase